MPLDKTEKIDLDKVQQQMNKDLGPAPGMPGTDLKPQAMPTPAEADKTQADEQKKIDDLFKK